MGEGTGAEMNQKEMDRIRACDERRAAARPARKEGLQYSLDRRAVMRAVRSEGREILTESGADYWKDQERKYPHLQGPRTDTGNNPAGTRNRFGRVGWRARWDAKAGRLVRERRTAEGWREEREG